MACQCGWHFAQKGALKPVYLVALSDRSESAGILQVLLLAQHLTRGLAKNSTQALSHIIQPSTIVASTRQASKGGGGQGGGGWGHYAVIIFRYYIVVCTYVAKCGILRMSINHKTCVQFVYVSKYRQLQYAARLWDRRLYKQMDVTTLPSSGTFPPQLYSFTTTYWSTALTVVHLQKLQRHHSALDLFLMEIP